MSNGLHNIVKEKKQAIPIIGKGKQKTIFLRNSSIEVLKMAMYEHVFLGTSSAEGLPNPVCNCPACQAARRLQGKNVRGRSSFKLSDEVMFDFGPDFVSQAQRYGGDLMRLEHVLITHTHYDHLSSFALCQYAGSLVPPEHPVKFYLVGDAYQMAEHILQDKALYNNGFSAVLEKGRVQFEKLSYFETYQIGEFSITPLPGRHPGTFEKTSANYLVERPDHKVLYYGTDTGYYLPETVKYLAGRHIDILITECTWGDTWEVNLEDKHLSLNTLKPLLEELSAQGTLDGDSRVYLTHISHNHQRMYDELQQFVGAWKEFPFPIFIAYDGMKIQ